MTLIYVICAVLLTCQFHPVHLVPRLSKGYENSGITEHTAFNCYVANADQPLELNISCSSPPPDRHSHSTKGQISKIKIVQGVYGYSQYPGIRCYFKHKDCFIDDIGGLKDCSGKVSCKVKVDRRYLGHKCGANTFSNYLMVAYQCIPSSSIHDICQSTFDMSHSSGFVISPGYPKPYYKGIDCQCNVSASSGGLLLRIVDFSTTELNCKHDYVAVHTARKIEKFCGELPMGTFYRTRESQISLQFITKLSARGFWIEYQGRSSKSLLTLACASLSSPPESSSVPTWRSDASVPDFSGVSIVDGHSSLGPFMSSPSSSRNLSSSGSTLENDSLKNVEKGDTMVARYTTSTRPKPSKSRKCPYWEVGCAPSSSDDGAGAGHSNDDDSSSSGGPPALVGHISTVFIVIGGVVVLVFFLAVFGAVMKKRQSALVVRHDEDPPSSADNGGLGSFYRGAKLSLDSINSSSEWNGVKNGGVSGVNLGAGANFTPNDIKGRCGNPPPSTPSHLLHQHPHLSGSGVGGGGVAAMAAGSSQSLEEWGRMDDFGLAAETHSDGRKSNFYRSRSFSMLDHVGQVSPYSRVPEIEISRSPDGLVQVGMMPNLTSLHYGDYGVLAVSPYQPSAVSPYGELCSLHGSIEPSPVTIITASPVLASNLDSSPQISPEK